MNDRALIGAAGSQRADRSGWIALKMLIRVQHHDMGAVIPWAARVVHILLQSLFVWRRGIRASLVDSGLNDFVRFLATVPRSERYVSVADPRIEWAAEPEQVAPVVLAVAAKSLVELSASSLFPEQPLLVEYQPSRCDPRGPLGGAPRFGVHSAASGWRTVELTLEEIEKRDLVTLTSLVRAALRDAPAQPLPGSRVVFAMSLDRHSYADLRRACSRLNVGVVVSLSTERRLVVNWDHILCDAMLMLHIHERIVSALEADTSHVESLPAVFLGSHETDAIVVRELPGATTYARAVAAFARSIGRPSFISPIIPNSEASTIPRHHHRATIGVFANPPGAEWGEAAVRGVVEKTRRREGFFNLVLKCSQSSSPRTARTLIALTNRLPVIRRCVTSLRAPLIAYNSSPFPRPLSALTLREYDRDEGCTFVLVRASDGRVLLTAQGRSPLKELERVCSAFCGFLQDGADDGDPALSARGQGRRDTGRRAAGSPPAVLSGEAAETRSLTRERMENRLECPSTRDTPVVSPFV